MATVKQILDIERCTFSGTVVLFEEGLFLKAYEESAYQLASRFGLKATKRMIKSVGEEVVSVGFPFASREKYVGDMIAKDGYFVAEFKAVGDEFEIWKNNVQLSEHVQQGKMTHPSKTIREQDADVIEMIRNFPVESKSLVECMLFLVDLKRSLKREEENNG